MKQNEKTGTAGVKPMSFHEQVLHEADEEGDADGQRGLVDVKGWVVVWLDRCPRRARTDEHKTPRFLLQEVAEILPAHGLPPPHHTA